MLSLRRKRAPEAPAAEQTSLADIPTSDLIRELVKRGSEIAVSGSWSETIRRLERRAQAAEQAACAYALRLRELRASSPEARLQRGELVDGTEAIEELTDLAAVELPRVAGELAEAWAENRGLQALADRTEAEASALAWALIGDDFDIDNHNDNH